MVGYKVALLLFGLAAVSALPQQRNEINWPDRPDWWPDRLPWPPSSADDWPERPVWWPLPQWPPHIPNEWPDQPYWWPEFLPWPPARPEQWPDRPDFWPESLPWPPARPEQWPDRPDFWPENLPWPPALPEEWPDRPDFWPESLPWPPARPEQWPDQPSWWPDFLPWPPAIPEQWPDQPNWWPDVLPWPPALPDLDSIWPPPGVDPDRIPYIPSRDNEFHLFTRLNPSWSQPLLIHNNEILRNSNFDPTKNTVILVHDIRSSATAAANSILVPAYLTAADVNIIAVDWSVGAWESDALSTVYGVLSGNFVSRFVRFLVAATGGDLEKYHLIGVGFAGLKVGFIGLRLNREVGYITALDPSSGPDLLGFVPALSVNAGKYYESIHTDTRQRGKQKPIGDVAFFPNGGDYQPGCGGDSDCNRNRAVYFFAESIQSGGFSGVECASWRDAAQGNCHGPGTLNLGGLVPKTGSTGVYYVRTNAVPPFSQG